MNRFVISQRSATIGRMAIAESNEVQQAYNGAKGMSGGGARDVQIYDHKTQKMYTIDAFAKEHGLK